MTFHLTVLSTSYGYLHAWQLNISSACSSDILVTIFIVIQKDIVVKFEFLKKRICISDLYLILGS